MEGWRNVLLARSAQSAGRVESSFRYPGTKRRTNGKRFSRPWNVTEGERQDFHLGICLAAKVPLSFLSPLQLIIGRGAAPRLALLLFCLVYDLVSVSHSFVGYVNEVLIDYHLVEC